MISSEPHKPAHQKHAKLARPDIGHFARNEWAILGTPCGRIKELAFDLTNLLSPSFKVAYVDADHKSADEEVETEKDATRALAYGASLEFTDKITFSRFDTREEVNDYQFKQAFNSQDLVLVNGNHFPARNQIIVIDPKKPLEKKLHKLTNVHLIVLQTGVSEVPEYVKAHLAEDFDLLPILHWEDRAGIAANIGGYMEAATPVLKGLVLAGGKSTRMQRDKGLIDYHGKPQRKVMYEQLETLGVEAYMSCREDQVGELADFRTIPDTLNGLGPFGAIASAFMEDPDAAWLVVACDLPFLSAETLQFLMDNRSPSATATAFQSPANEFPEPLISIWEPRAYGTLMHFLTLGYSCPRKVLINSPIELLQAPVSEALTNVNDPAEYEAAQKKLKQ